MWNPLEFPDLVLWLGNFHLINILLRVIGKYVRGSRADKIWVQNNIFGTNIVQQVLSGSDYELSMTGMTLLAETMQRLQLSQFFHMHGVDKNRNVLGLLSQLKVSVLEKIRSKVRIFLFSLILH